jgi:hypothetical protein
MNKKKIIAALLCAGLTVPVLAKEGGDQYPNGAENWLAGAIPPPGDYFINYFGYYSGDLVDGDGRKVKGGNDVSAWFDALRYVHVSERKFLGGNWGWHVIMPFVYQDLSLGGRSSDKFALGDMTFNPFFLAWHKDNWHWVAGVDINVPTGKYKSGDPTKSIGANYWSFEPLFAFTYLGDTGWEVSAKFMYNIKTENQDFRPARGAPKMDYQSGDEFHMDYLVGKRFGQWGVGLAGYYLKQTTDDEIDGKKISSEMGPWSDGRRGQVFAIGPSVTYTTAKGTHMVAQWQHESHVENRFEGDKFYFKLIMPLQWR